MTFFLSVTMLLTWSIESVLGSKIVKSEDGAAPFHRTCAVSFCNAPTIILGWENWQLHIEHKCHASSSY